MKSSMATAACYGASRLLYSWYTDPCAAEVRSNNRGTRRTCSFTMRRLGVLAHGWCKGFECGAFALEHGSEWYLLRVASGAPASFAVAMKGSRPMGDFFSLAKVSRPSQSLSLARAFICIFSSQGEAAIHLLGVPLTSGRSRIKQ